MASIVSFLLLTLLIILGIIQMSFTVCPSGWKTSASLSSCYIYVSNTKKMCDAMTYCYEEYKAVVAMPKSQDENNFLKSIHPNGAGKVWIGITDRDVDGLWEYFDGDPLDVTDFSQYPWEQPPTGTSSEECVFMKNNGQWSYEICTDSNTFWCQKDFNIPDSCTHLDGWFKDPYEDTCYKDFGNGDYNRAITKCEFQGYEVLMPKTKRKHVFVQWFIKEYVRDEVWIGLTDLHQEGKFEWHSGSDTGFRAFKSGEPNNLNGNQHCVRYDNIFGGDYEWNDWKCTSSQTNIVCQEPESQFLTTTTVPSTTGTSPATTAPSTTVTSPALSTSPDLITWTTTEPTITTDVDIGETTTNLVSTGNPNDYCPCPCHLTNMSIIMDTIAKLQEELKVHTETLSSTIRSKTCAEDPRPSAKNIGIMGVVVLSVIFSLVFLMDLISIRKTIS